MSSEAKTETAAASAATQEAASVSLLDQAIEATRNTKRDEMQDLLRTLTSEALSGTVTFSKNLTQTFNRAIEAIDEKLSKQLSAIMHHADFQKLEGSWRGLNHLVKNSETGATLKIRMMNLSKKDLHKDLTKAVEFDQSQIFKKIYETEFGTPGGEPYGALIGDYAFGSGTEDLEVLQGMSNVAAASFAPFISAANPDMFGLESFTELSKPSDLEKIFESSEYIKWRSFRESEDSRFVTLTMPRVLSDSGSIATTKSDCASNSGSGVWRALPCSSGACADRSTGRRAWYSTGMPKPSDARRAIAWPMRPKPSRPSVLPCTSKPKQSSPMFFVQRPLRTRFDSSTTRRLVAISSANTVSATVSSSTPGVWASTMPRRCSSASA